MIAPLRLVLLLAATALVVTASASAAPPSRETLSLDETFVYPVGTPDNPCPSSSPTPTAAPS